MGSRLQARRVDVEQRALVRLTVSYLAVFAAVIGALSAVAYLFIDTTYRSIVAPALATAEGRAGFAAAMRPALFAIVSVDALLLVVVGAASFALARAALQPVVAAREREERFSADVAHELRTPLAAIASMAEAAIGGEPPAAQVALFAVARRAFECGELVAALLTLARASDPDSLNCELVDLGMVASKSCAEAPAARNVRVTCAAESAIVAGDERRLQQLVRNLLDNACAHARAEVRLTVCTENRDALLGIEDDGSGVAPELRAQLFERFAKGTDSKGSGLGLAICRWVARAHRGDITFAGGSKFEVRLPLATIPHGDA